MDSCIPAMAALACDAQFSSPAFSRNGIRLARLSATLLSLRALDKPKPGTAGCLEHRPLTPAVPAADEPSDGFRRL